MRHLPIYAFALFVPAVVASVLLPSNETPELPSNETPVGSACPHAGDTDIEATSGAHHHFAALDTHVDVVGNHDALRFSSTNPSHADAHAAAHANGLAHSHDTDVSVGADTGADVDKSGTDERLKGLWSRHDGREDGKQLRFYYFHDGGIGLYRYGRVGLNNTHSYTYTTARNKLGLTFKKTGRKVSSDYRIVEEDGRQVLVLQQDPYEPTPVKYFKEMGPMGHALDVDDVDVGVTNAANVDPNDGAPGFDRMWTHVDKFKNGGIEFSIYQFKAPALDGRGVGWHHRGDFDNWSTETLYYRRDVNGLSLTFPQRRERALSKMKIKSQGGRRTLSLTSDPRNYWQAATFVDGGKAFAADTHSHANEPVTLSADSHAGVDGDDADGKSMNQWLHLVNHTAAMQ